MEQSESGAPIHRHEQRTQKFEFAIGDSENIERISAHIQTHLGPISNVYHEIISDLVHIDVHIVAPTSNRNFYTLVTSGMSDRPMAAPEAFPQLRYSELLIALPPDWPMADEAFKRPENYWPVHMLKFLARFPHAYNTWLWEGHTIPNGDPPEPFASNTQLTGIALLPPLTAPLPFHQLVIDPEKTIHFHAIVPLHTDEMNLKLQKGIEALYDSFDEHRVTEILNPQRPSVIPSILPSPPPAKRSWFSFFKRS